MIHGDTVSKQHNGIKKLKLKLTEMFQIVKIKAIQIYSRTRTFFRINFLNRRTQENRSNLKTLKKWILSQ